MQQKIKGIWDKVTQRWKGLSKKIKGLLAALLVLVLVGVVLLVVFTGTDSTYTTLFHGADAGRPVRNCYISIGERRHRLSD